MTDRPLTGRNTIRNLILSFVGFILFACITGEKKEFTPDPKIIEETEVEALPLGAEAPGFYLPGADGRFYKNSDFDRSKLLLVFFTCNHCPESQMYEDQLIDLVDDYRRKKLQVVCISPNSPLAVLYEDLRYSDLNDDYNSMMIRAQVKEFNFPYLYDGDDHEVSLKFGPQHTPHVFLFDSDRKLRYRGRPDEVLEPGKVNFKLVRDAVDALLDDKEVNVKETKTRGCDIKWAWQYEKKKKEDRWWFNRPVRIKDIDLESIKILLSNPTKKMLLLNFWASWCPPCKKEMPGIIEAYRMYYHDLELVTISIDDHKDKEKALSVLKKFHFASSNYIYKDKSSSELINSVKPFWNGSVPLTMLIEPGGELANMWYGPVTPYVLRRTIVNNKQMGRYRK